MHRREVEPEEIREAALAAGEFQAEERRPWDLADAVGAAGEFRPVQQHDANDLAEGQSDDGEVVSSQAQHRKAQDDAPEAGQNEGHRQAGPEAEVEIGRQQGVGIGPHRVEGDVAEVEQAGEAHDDVQPPAQHDVGEDERTQVDMVALGPRQHGQGQRHEDQRRADGRADEARILLEPRRDQIVDLAAGPAPDGQVEDQPADEDGADRPGHPVPMLLDDEARRGLLGPEPHDDAEQAERDQRGDHRVLEHVADVDARARGA